MTIRFDAFGSQDTRSTAVRRRPSFYDKYGKRALDVALVFIALPVVVPVIALLALLVALSGGKPFYAQDRLGQGGRVFRIYKLRSMIPNADQVLDAYLAENPEARAEWNLKQKLTDDPRITALGAVLRKTSMDELPQLFNVLRGDMSLVGPRPMMPAQKALYPGKAYELMRPGITGPWQVSDRNLSSFASRAAFDTHYYEDLTMKEDLSFLVKTMAVVCRGTGC